MDKSKKVTSNVIWKFMEKFGAQLVTFVVSIILARLLDPEAYGTIAIITVFIALLQVFIDGGFGTALIQKKDADDLDFSTVFWFNIVFCSILYVGMFFAAPLIAAFYEMPSITPIIRVMSLTLIISGVKNVEHAYVSKKLIFKKFFFATLAGTLIATLTGIWMAYNGYGVWALVAQNLINQFIDTIVLYFTVKWKPKFMFSWKRFIGLFSYGWKLLVSSILDTLYGEIREIIIGKKYSAEDLAYYHKGVQFPKLVMSNITSSIDAVLLPSLAEENDNKARVKAMTKRTIKVTTFIMMPMMMGLALIAEPLVTILLTEKWLPCVLYLRIFCFDYAFFSIHTSNLDAIKAVGRSDLFLKLEIAKKIFGTIMVLSTMFISVEAMGLSIIAIAIVDQFINSWPNKELIDYGYGEQFKDMLPHIILTVIMGGAVYAASFIPVNMYLLIAIQIVVGIIVYVSGAYLAKFETFNYCLNFATRFFKRSKDNSKTENGED